MSEEILVNVTPMETRVAVVDNGATQDIHIERTASRGMVGNIYAGKVVRVLPGMQAAFVDIGAERTSFIHVSDIFVSGGDGRAQGSDAIGDYLHEGKKVIVQVTKDPLGSKGARITTELSVSSRYLVFMPQSNHVGVSQQIDDALERDRLQQLLADGIAAEEMEAGGGYILRTAAEGVGLDEVRADLRFLKRLWSAVSRRGKKARKAELLYSDLALHMRTVRDLARPGVERILVDSRESYNALTEFCNEYMPEVSDLLEHYCGERPLFDLHGIEEELQGALGRKVGLKSGGYLIIDQTEAMTTVDVNTGGFVSGRSFDDTIFKTNLEAAQVIARQLRLRNLGGIIIIDFIDMRDEAHRQQVLDAFERALQPDHAQTQVAPISPLGLVEMTRKRTRESLEHLLCEVCPSCEGHGSIRSVETVCQDIFREILRQARQFGSRELLVLAHQDVIERLLGEESTVLAELAAETERPIRRQAQAHYEIDRYDVVLV